MAITSIKIDLETFMRFDVGMPELPLDPPFEMRAIGPIVVLAGPNGSGKSRILRLLKTLIDKKPTPEFERHSKELIAQESRSLKVFEGQEAEALEKERSGQPNELSVARNNLAQLRSRLEGYRTTLDASNSISLSSDEPPAIIRFVPSVPTLVDPFNTTELDASQRADALSLGPENAQQNAPAYARRILRRAMEAESKRFKQESGHLLPKTPAELSSNALLELMASLLGPDITLDLDDARLLIGPTQPYSTTLSPGQQILFQFACMLHARGSSLANSIVVMDEPENHLHPAVLAEIVAALRQQLGNSQLWIATHSVPLIAQLMAVDNKCLWFVNKDRVKHSGRSPEVVLESLMGGTDGAHALHELTMLPAQYAAIRFLTECLDDPEVVGPNIKDPQTRQITKLLESLAERRRDADRKLRVLDFGAGKGRVLATLRDSDPSVASWLDYFAYDIAEQDRSECEREIALTYPGDSRERWFSDLSLLEARAGADLDVVIMCNVLHEVHPDDWLLLMATNGRLSRLISSDGFLLVVEDYGIPVGERAHDYGFLLLDEQELSHLFAVAPADRDAHRFSRQTSSDSRYAERLNAFLIAKACLDRLTPDTQRAAIDSLRRRMADTVRTFLRDKNARSTAAGRDYARSAQLLANADIWLEAHQNSKVESTAGAK